MLSLDGQQVLCMASRVCVTNNVLSWNRLVPFCFDVLVLQCVCPHWVWTPQPKLDCFSLGLHVSLFFFVPNSYVNIGLVFFTAAQLCHDFCSYFVCLPVNRATVYSVLCRPSTHVDQSVFWNNRKRVCVRWLIGLMTDNTMADKLSTESKTCWTFEKKSLGSSAANHGNSEMTVLLTAFRWQWPNGLVQRRSRMAELYPFGGCRQTCQRVSKMNQMRWRNKRGHLACHMAITHRWRTDMNTKSYRTMNEQR